MKKSFKIEPSTNIMDVLGHSGYTFDTAIADIIDNSIAAHAKNITIFFDVKNEKTYLYILDDGDGMNIQKLHQCIIPAYKDINDIREDDDLGRYSLGLKSASKSFCEQLYVCSKEKNKKANTVELDFFHIKNTKKWEAYEIDDFKFENKLSDNGTLVLWNNVTFKNTSLRADNMLIYEMFEKLQTSLSHIFGKYILEEKVNIYIQSSGSSKKTRIEGWNPFDLLENKTTKIISKKKLTCNGKDIIVTTYILPTYANLSDADKNYMKGWGLIEQQGFYIYRNNRLIQEGGWLNLDGITADQKCEYARIEVLLGTNLDEEFDVNFSKCKVSIPHNLTSDFYEIAQYARKSSKSNYDYLKTPDFKKRIKKNSDIKVWNTYKTSEGLKLSINTKHPIIEEILGKLSTNDANKLLSLISNTIPISMIQVQGGYEEKYNDNDIKNLISDTFNKLYQDEKDISLIKKQMFKTEPFTMYGELLVEFFLKKEKQLND